MALSRLQAFIDQHSLHIDVAAGTEKIDGLSAAEFTIGRAAPSIRFTVFDEYGDARQENQMLCLALLRMEFSVLQDAKDAAVWMRSQSIDAENTAGEVLYQRNLKAMHAFFERYGPIPEVVSDLEWQLNSGAAQMVEKA